MLRRKFLKLLGGAAVVPLIPRTTSAPRLLHDAAHHDLTEGFGLAPIKAEGSKVAFDPMPGQWLSEASLEQMFIEIKKTGLRLGIRPTLIQRGVDDERLG